VTHLWCTVFRWVGYGSDQDSWEPFKNILDPSLIDDYLARAGLAATPGLEEEKVAEGNS
jgi:hypothetical protein